MKRSAKYQRKTLETQVSVELGLDGSGEADIKTGIGFFDHMLELLAKHGMMDLKVACNGDLKVDCHHTVEDVGICLGNALKKALGSKESITRYGAAAVPMDEALGFAAVDMGGRAFLVYEAPFSGIRCGDYELQCTEEFFRALANNAGLTLHIRSSYGSNDHHMIEAMFKAFSRALAQAVTLDPRVSGVLSTKGLL